MDLGGYTFRVITTPGHTRDSITYYIKELKAIIPGEAVGVFDRKFNIRPQFLSSYKDYFSSLEKLAPLKPQIICMSHNHVLTGSHAMGFLERSLTATVEFRQRIEKELDALGGNRDDVVKKIHGEDYVAGVIPQDAKSYLINLGAMVKTIAESK